MASSSSYVHNKTYKYDVFLSFNGEDTRKTFVDHLYAALDQQGICTFKDDERLEKGKNISDDLLQSIEDSRFFIIVFSKRYASSSWCLKELLKIMECCHKTSEHTAFPVFYDVDPSEVRKQSGLVGEALATHTNKSELEVAKWRETLKEAANLSGWDLKKTANGHEAKLIKYIVERVSLELWSINTSVDENLINMEPKMHDLEKYLQIDMNDVRMIGIKGMGGIGKTTLARAIYDKISFNFEGRSFVDNVRERASQSGLKKLQKQILTDVLKDDNIKVKDVYEGKNLIKRKLCGKKVLIVLDDVDREEQLEELAGDPSWFKSGSRIIITTRDEQVLNTYLVKSIFEVDLLSDEDAIRLFNRHAFKRTLPNQEYETQSHEVVRYAAGLPLTIKVLGSFLRGKTKTEWTDALSRLKTIPLKETLKKLKLSYESLEDDYKEIFLDVACFLRHWKKDDAVRVLESCGFHATSGLKVLEQKSLIKVVGTILGGEIHMHDHIVELGVNIIRSENPNEPNKHSRLWIEEEVKHVLANGLGTDATRCIEFKTSREIVLKGLRNMNKLRCLIVNRRKRSYYNDLLDGCVITTHEYFPNSLRYLYWRYYPHWCLPNTFEADNLVSLEMPDSQITQLWKGGKVMKNLKFINLSHSTVITSKLKSLDLGMTPNLERLDLHNCTYLIKLDVHGGCLKSLVYLNLSRCYNLKSILFIEQLESLEVLRMSLSNLSNFPDCITTGRSTNSLLELDLSLNQEIKEVPSSVGNIHNLVELMLYGCFYLKILPESICSLQHLRTLNVAGTDIEELPDNLGQLECLETLKLSRTRIKHLPDSICMLKHLKTLDLRSCKALEKLPDNIGMLVFLEFLDLEDCYNLRDIPTSICKMKRLKELKLKDCKRLEKLPVDLGDLECLQELYIQGTFITHLPPSICLLKHLKTLFLSRCYALEKLPDSIGMLESLEKLDVAYCSSLRVIPSSISKLKRLKELNLDGCSRHIYGGRS